MQTCKESTWLRSHNPSSVPLPVFTGSSEEPLVDLSEVLKSDTELLGMLSDDMSKQTEESGRPSLTEHIV